MLAPMARLALLLLVAIAACAAPRKSAPPPAVGAAPLDPAPRDEQQKEKGADSVALGGEEEGHETNADPCEGGEVTGDGGIGKGGPGGGGTGYGTGTGGLGGGRQNNPPTVTVGNPAPQGSLDKDIIRRVIKQALPKIRYCYEKELVADASLQGTVTAKFVISPTGAVISSSAAGINASIEGCIAAVVKQLQFPAPTGGGSVSVSYPFTFKPAS